MITQVKFELITQHQVDLWPLFCRMLDLRRSVTGVEIPHRRKQRVKVPRMHGLGNRFTRTYHMTLPGIEGEVC
jgi:hypothetical protein